MKLAWWLNTAWMVKCLPEARAFCRATRRVAAAQADVLHQILRRNEATDFGRAHDFRRIRNVRQFQECVPLSTYENYAAYIELIASGRGGVLTTEPVELLQPTSGTTGGEKLIPFTASLGAQFQRAVAAWIADLFQRRPQVRAGRAYWSISPAMEETRQTAGGIRIGFKEDSEYLGLVERWALARLLVAPDESRERDIELFRYSTLLSLMLADDLALISVWSPTFLTALLGGLEQWQDQIVFDLKHGTCGPCSGAAADTTPKAQRRIRDERRAQRLREIFSLQVSLAEKLRLVWPRLTLISCWTDATAAAFLPELTTLFSDVEIQSKGLLATEGCVSFPLIDRAAPVLAIQSHFFEFQESVAQNDDAACRLAHELHQGGRYRVILTTGGGLYRYQLRDEVEVLGFEGQCPLLRFIGKTDRVSDMVGEKLAEPHVRQVLEAVFWRHRLSPSFALLVPVKDQSIRYRLYLELPDIQSQINVAALADELEAGLQQNPHYRWAAHLRQLAHAEVTVLSSTRPSAWRIYERRCLTRAHKIGNIKPAVLDSWLDWPQEFHPLIATRSAVRPTELLP